MNKYKGILILSGLIISLLFTCVNYFAFIFTLFPNGFWLFLIFEFCCITIVVILFIFALKLDKILEHDGYYRLSDEKLLELKDEKINMDIIMNSKNFLNTSTNKKVNFDQIQPIKINKKIDINE